MSIKTLIFTLGLVAMSQVAFAKEKSESCMPPELDGQIRLIATQESHPECITCDQINAKLAKRDSEILLQMIRALSEPKAQKLISSTLEKANGGRPKEDRIGLLLDMRFVYDLQTEAMVPRFVLGLDIENQAVISEKIELAVDNLFYPSLQWFFKNVGAPRSN